MSIIEEGRRAFAEGKAAQAVPYADWERRSRWIRGWYAAEHEHRIHWETRLSVAR